MKTLFLSIGHNWGRNGKAIDQGAFGNGTSEAAENKKIIDAIVARGIPGVKLVKVPEGLNLAERIAWINKNIGKNPEPFAIEFHMDAATPKATGATVYYNDANTYTENEGKQFLAEYTNVTGLVSRHVISDTKNRHGQLGFVSEVKCASLLIETGFISNKNDLATVRQKGADAIIAGVNAMNAR